MRCSSRICSKERFPAPGHSRAHIREALAMLERDIDCVLLDLKLPDARGLTPSCDFAHRRLGFR